MINEIVTLLLTRKRHVKYNIEHNSKSISTNIKAQNQLPEVDNNYMFKGF